MQEDMTRKAYLKQLGKKIREIREENKLTKYPAGERQKVKPR